MTHRFYRDEMRIHRKAACAKDFYATSRHTQHGTVQGIRDLTFCDVAWRGILEHAVFIAALQHAIMQPIPTIKLKHIRGHTLVRCYAEIVTSMNPFATSFSVGQRHESRARKLKQHLKQQIQRNQPQLL